MDISIFLARAYGLYFGIMGNILYNKSEYYFRLIRDFFQNRVLVFAVAWVTLILGILVVLSHNVWELSWKVIITILGYLTLLEGIMLLNKPEVMGKANFSIDIPKHRFLYGAFCLSGICLLCVSFLK